MKIRPYTWTLIFLFVASLLQGCSTAVVHKSLTDDLKSSPYQIKVLSKIPANEILIPVKERKTISPAGGNLVSLLFMLGETAVNKGLNEAKKSAARKRVLPLREASADMDFREQYWNTLKETLDGSSWLKVQQLDRRTLGYTKEEAADMTAPFLILTTFYQLSGDSQVLVVQTGANLYLHDLKSRDYFGFYTYFSGKVGKNNEKDDDAIKLWAQDGAKIYRTAVAEGIEQNMSMFKMDLLDRETNLTKVSDEEINMRILDPISGVIHTFQGHLISRKESRILLREKGGNLFSIATDLEKPEEESPEEHD